MKTFGSVTVVKWVLHSCNSNECQLVVFWLVVVHWERKKQQLRAPLQAHIQKIKMKAPSTGPSKSSDSFATKSRESPHSFGSDHVSLRKLHMAVSIKSILISRWYHRSDRRQSCTQVLISLSGTVFICLIIIPSYNNPALVRKKWEYGLGRPCLLVKPLTNRRFKAGVRIPYWTIRK